MGLSTSIIKHSETKWLIQRSKLPVVFKDKCQRDAVLYLVISWGKSGQFLQYHGSCSVTQSVIKRERFSNSGHCKHTRHGTWLVPGVKTSDYAPLCLLQSSTPKLTGRLNQSVFASRLGRPEDLADIKVRRQFGPKRHRRTSTPRHYHSTWQCKAACLIFPRTSPSYFSAKYTQILIAQLIAVTMKFLTLITVLAVAITLTSASLFSDREKYVNAFSTIERKPFLSNHTSPSFYLSTFLSLEPIRRRRSLE
jgi:hypothetical protein